MSTSRTREKADGELFKSTGIDDNATSTAITIDASENVGIGTSSTSGVRLQATTPTANHIGLQVENSNTSDSFGMVVKAGNDANDYTADFRKRDNTNILRIHGDGNVTVNNGNLVIGTNGKGIDFSANADSSATGASTTSELLDDYEEGTWTPAFAGYTGTQPTIGSTQYHGTYTKIGNLVTLSAFLHAGSISGNTAEILVITGLPFDMATTGHVSGSYTSQNLNFVRPPVGSGLTGVVGGKLAFLTAVNNAAHGWEKVSILGTSGYIDCDIRMTVTYRTT